MPIITYQDAYPTAEFLSRVAVASRLCLLSVAVLRARLQTLLLREIQKVRNNKTGTISFRNAIPFRPF